jgi:hypothetical protein
MQKTWRNRMLIFKFLKKIPKLFIDSYKSAHLLTFAFASILFIIYKFRQSPDSINYVTPEIYFTVLGTLGLLLAFFTIALEKVNFSHILARYTKSIPVIGVKYDVTQGNLLTNTLFSFFIASMFLISAQYILFIVFNYCTIILLLLTICYMLVGFIIVVCVWHGSECIKSQSQN